MIEKRQLDIAMMEWLETSKKRSVKEATYDRLIISYRLMEKYPIAKFQVNDIDAGAMQRYVNWLAEDGYGISTIKKQFNLLTAYWKYAFSQGLVDRPVYLGVSLPREENLRTKHREVETYAHDEQRRLMDILKTLRKPQYGVIVLMLETGMRIGEALALRWSDILWSRKAVSIHGTLVRLSSEPGITYVQNSPKSRSSRRIVPLSSTAMDILRELKAEGASEQDLVFAKPDDQKVPYSYSSVEFHIRNLCEKLDIPYRGMHAFRHTFATNCYERGCDVKILSKLLGHADVSVTFNIYIHLYGDALEEMRKVLG